MDTEASIDFTASKLRLTELINDITWLIEQNTRTEKAGEFFTELTELVGVMERARFCLAQQPAAVDQAAVRDWNHELRNLLNVVKGFAELCQERQPEVSEYHASSALAATVELAVELGEQPQTLPDSEAELSVEATSSQRHGKILVVEDNAENRQLLTRVLRAQGHTVFAAETAAEAFEHLQRADIELILLDLILPDMNGFEILQQLKSNAELRAISVIMVSGQQEFDEAIRCIQAGAEDYLLKPVNQVLLNARIDASLERKSWRDREQQYLAELAKSRDFIRQTFGRYTSEEIVDRLLEDPNGLDLGGRLQDVSILMSDISGFTSLCGRLTPQQVVQLLNNYLGTLSEVILAHQGTIDEFIGDAILAIFGAPFSNEDDAERATQCALAMQQAMAEVNRKNLQDGLPSIETSIAVHSGKVIAGNIGSERRSKFAIVGQPVNLAARIEEVAGPAEVLISESTRSALQTVPALGRTRIIKAKGFRQPVTVHELLVPGVSPAQVAEPPPATHGQATEAEHV